MLRAHLWKEWREQRGLLLTLVGLLIVLAGVAYLVIDAHQLGADYRLDSLPTWMFHVGVLVGVVVLASELVPGESRRGQLGWMLRLPHAMRHAFVAKWIMLLGGTLLLAVVGAGAGLVVASLHTQPDRAPGIELWLGENRLAQAQLLLGAVATFAPWAFAVSCWMPRGTLVVPTALVVVAPVVVPLSWLSSAHAGLAPFVVGVPWAFTSIALAGSMGAWLSFRHGSARRLSALPLTAGATLGALVPLLIGVAVRVHAWHHVDVCDPGARIVGGFLGSGGKRAFLVIGTPQGESRIPPCYPVVADLQTGQWEQHGPPMASFSSAGVLDHGELQLPSQPGLHRLIVRHQRTTDGQAVAGPPTILDGHTGAQLGVGELQSCPPEALEMLCQERMLNTNLRDRDGRRIWFERGVWYREAPRGDTAPEKLAHVVGQPGFGCGIGLRLHVPGSTQPWVLDPTRVRRFTSPANTWVVVLADTWLVRDRGTRTWITYDPETEMRGESVSLQSINLLDERTLVSIDAETGELFGLAPATMERRRIEVDAGPGKLVAVIAASATRWGVLRSPGGAPTVVLRYETGPKQWRVAYGRYRDGRIITTDHANDLTLLGFAGDDAVIAIVDERRIERLRFGGGREVLFPR